MRDFYEQKVQAHCSLRQPGRGVQALGEPRFNGLCRAGKAKRVSLPDLKMSRTAPRPSQGLLDRGEVTAGKREARCQSLVKVRLAERGDAE
jgi:hypothetical protein